MLVLSRTMSFLSMNKTKQRNNNILQMQKWFNKVLPLIVGLILISFLAEGCSSPTRGSRTDHKDKESSGRQSTPKIDESKVKEFANHGYDSGIEYSTESLKLILSIDSISTEINIVQPVRKGKYPLVIYLPGLGESNEAGKSIRQSWATSGYVVITFQSLKDDETIMSTAAAKEGDFSYIRHDRYSAEVISSRLTALNKFIENIKLSADSNGSSLNNIDLDHVAIVGYDIGALTAMIVAGEEAPSIANPKSSLKLSCVVALSPYADFSGSAFNSRYQNIHLPVLSVTGDADDDTHGVVPITLHQAPFQFMPEGNKYLLLLAGATHSVIGNAMQTSEAFAADRDEAARRSDNENSGKGSGRSRGGRNGKKSSSSDNNNSSVPAKRPPASPTQRAMMAVSIEQISTAFLNSYVKRDNLAMEWLRNHAQPWLYNMGQLKVK